MRRPLFLLFVLLPFFCFSSGSPRHDYGRDKHVGYIVLKDSGDTLYGIIRLTAFRYANGVELLSHGVFRAINLSAVRIYPQEPIYPNDSTRSFAQVRDNPNYTDYESLNKAGQVLWRCIARGKAKVFDTEYAPFTGRVTVSDRFCVADSVSVKTIRFGGFRYSGVGVFKRFINRRYGTSFHRRDFVSARAAIDYISTHG